MRFLGTIGFCGTPATRQVVKGKKNAVCPKNLASNTVKMYERCDPRGVPPPTRGDQPVEERSWPPGSGIPTLDVGPVARVRRAQLGPEVGGLRLVDSVLGHNPVLWDAGDTTGCQTEKERRLPEDLIIKYNENI
jgi:hypothetical protein